MNQFYDQIEREFSKGTATKIKEYFAHHQFEWNDIADDIRHSYHDCCAKIVFFDEEEHIRDITDNVEQQYMRLKSCLTSNHSAMPSSSVFDGIFQDCLTAFTAVFNTENANEILHLFKAIVLKEFDDIESIIDDIDDIQSSQIIADLKGKVDYKNFDKNTETVQNIIRHGITFICKHQTDEFIKQYKNASISQTPNESLPSQQRQKQIETDKERVRERELRVQQTNAGPHEEIHTTPQHAQSDVFVEKMKQQIMTEINSEIANLFERSVYEQEYDELEQIKDDIEEDMDNSLILDYIKERMNQEKMDLKSLHMKIKDIVMNYGNPSKVTPSKADDDDDEKKEEEEDVNIKKIKIEIMKKFSDKYDKTFAIQMLHRFIAVLNDEGFDFENLCDDVQDIGESTVLDALEMKEMCDDDDEEYKESQDMKYEIRDIILNTGEHRFDIKAFCFQVTKQEVAEASHFVTRNCPKIYQHLMGIAKTLDESELSPNLEHYSKPKPKIEGKSLCIAKSIDAKNGQPIMYWLLMLFSKQRSAKYRSGELAITKKYTVNDWWDENPYCQWIQEKYAKIANNIEAGLADLVKRTLPPLNYNYPLFPTICDRLDDFVEYALAFDYVAVRIQKLAMKGELNAVPIQIDYWIIPRLTKRKGGNRNTMPFNAHFISESEQVALQNARQEALTLSEDGPDAAGSGIGNIEQLLNHRKLGYSKEKDYFVKYVDDGEQRGGILGKWITNETIKRRRNRYIIVIDRRDPDTNESENKSDWHEREKTWKDTVYLIAPKQYRNEQGKALCTCGAQLEKKSKSTMHNVTTCAWCQRGDSGEAHVNGNVWCCPKRNAHPEGAYYLCSDQCQEARPDTFGEISREWQRLPESCLSLSKSYILFNPNSLGSVPITLDDALNGYMFGISYHILSQDTISVYWYHNAAGTIFQLNDIEKGWPQWFDKVKQTPQQVHPAILKEIKSKAELPNKGFKQFESQTQILAK